ncbi:hypothetical protein AAG570_005496 [Ranatra chinensis]|uniref:Tuberin n=1 Tax=Ranatra chinensis TaxID=642074 RepID=A0ABD0XXL5_9HEMI
MSAKDKESKTLEKIKQFFRINRGVPGNLRPREDFVLSNVLEKDLCSESPTAQRIKTVKEIVETVLNHKLEDNAIAKLWYLLEDLVAPGNPKENRHVVFSFCRALIQGQYERLGMMRAQFFKFIKNHDVEEDIGPRLELLQSLTDHGRDILYLEEEMALFLLDWMPTVIDAGREQDFLQILINVIKYNTAYVDEELVASFVQSTCVLCCQSCNEEVVLTCLQVLDTVVCYTSLPPKSLSPFVATLCRTVNIEIYCPTSWKIMRNLLGTHLGHSSLYTMCTLLQCESSLSDVGLLRGAVFHINMALWGNKRVPSLKCTPTSVLPSFKMALRCKHSLVMYEVMLSVQRLVNKHGIELLDPSWSIVLVIIQTIIKDLENSPPSQCLNQISIHLHDTLTMVEQMIELGQFNGSVQTVFEIIESCSPHRPETSVLRLVSYLASSILPTRHLWLEKLESLVIKYFKQETRPNIRIKVLSILATVIQNNRSLYEEELVEIVLRYLGGIAQEGDIAVRSAAAQLLVDLCLNSEPKHALEVMDILEKLLNRAFEQNEIANSEEDAADIKMTAHGLVQALTNGLFSYPPAPAMRAFHLITNHLMTHYNEPKHLTNVTSIRYMMLECLLRLRADTHYRIGLCGPTTRYSMYLLAHNIAPQITSKVEMDVLPISNAIRAIIRAVKDELDWKVMLMVLQELPQLLKNRALLVSKSGSEVDLIATALCAMVCDKSLCLPEVLKNTPPKFTRSDLHNYVFPVLASLVSYHAYLEPKLQQRLIKCLEYGLVSRSARQCVLALTTCVLEMRDAMVKLLPEVLLNLSKISATVHIAIPILEFLSTLTQLPKVFANFVGDQYMSVFAISLPYTNPFTAYNHFTVSLAHHVIAAWFLKCRLPFRRDFVKYITNALKGNVKPFEDSLYKAEKVNEMVNEDSSNRKRSSSLTEQGSRKRERPVSTRLDLKPPIDEKLIEFHRELTETCIDLMAMYTFSTCSPQPKRHSTAELLLSGGQSMTWLLGNKLITVTTSGCNLKALKHGLCDRCYQVCRINPDLIWTVLTAGIERIIVECSCLQMVSNDSTAASTPDEEKPSVPDSDTTKLEHIHAAIEKTERQICGCWCQGWAEIFIRRPTGAMSWIMRLQNEPHSPNVQDVPYSDISSLFLSSTNSPKMYPDELEQVSCERVCSKPVSIPGSPVRRNVHSDFDDLVPHTEEGSGRSRNPVRRSNSSPEMSASWKNPLMNSSLASNADEADHGDGKKKQNYSKDLR